ncbi:hypothetical protein C4D60_Mb09t14110 [Musa balbisiana]|uniref:Uncharacterized protein n=1 Tax=Musa balbisiana TaxID=52838 RepID=A0A4V4H385_MUSBA|nr:hypothetical protein C4D60_Mb09t14110 [Musa balbisiana]
MSRGSPAPSSSSDRGGGSGSTPSSVVSSGPTPSSVVPPRVVRVSFLHYLPGKPLFTVSK